MRFVNCVVQNYLVFYDVIFRVWNVFSCIFEHLEDLHTLAKWFGLLHRLHVWPIAWHLDLWSIVHGCPLYRHQSYDLKHKELLEKMFDSEEEEISERVFNSDEDDYIIKTRAKAETKTKTDIFETKDIIKTETETGIDIAKTEPCWVWGGSYIDDINEPMDYILDGLKPFKSYKYKFTANCL